MQPFAHLAQPPAARTHRKKSSLEVDVRLILCVCAALLIAALWAVTLWQLHKNEQSELNGARRDAISLARLFKEHADRTIEATDEAMIYLRYRYNILGNKLNITQVLQERLEQIDIYNLFSIADSNGDLILSTRPFAPVNLADRDHVKVHMQSDSAGLYISKPTLGRVSKKWSLQMTRRISAPDGSFKGVVIASIDPGYFTALYRDIDVGQFGAIALIGEDGVIRVRHVGKDDAMGQDVSDAPVFLAMHANGSGVIRTYSKLDGRDRLFAYDKLSPYPLYVAVGIDIGERLTEVRSNRTTALVLISLSSLLILIGTAALVILIGNLMESRHEALQASKAKLHFLSNMSHELRTPLNGILGYSETLLEDFSGTRHGEFARAIHDSGMRLLGLVDAVLELSSLRSGNVHLTFNEEVLKDIITYAVTRHEEKALKKGLHISVAIAAETPEQILCDRNKLLQVLDKLLDNAVRFTDTGSIVISVSKDGGDFLFSITDTGCGIAPELQSKIFEKFAQSDDSATRTHGGAGLGLTIAALLIDLMDGEISVQSMPQAGSSFSFRLPVIRVASAQSTHTMGSQRN